MKKFLAFAALASVALVGCVNDEKMEMTSGAQKISFDTPVMSTQTRANEFGEIDGNSTPVTYPITEDFVVYAKQHSGVFDGWSTATDFWPTTGLKVSYDNEKGYWDTETDYYWPEAPYQLTFAAYSPAVCSGTKSYGPTGLTITDFESPESVAEQYDLMYSVRSKNNNEASNASSGAYIRFKHALSSIVFAAVDEDTKASYQITSLKLSCDDWGCMATFTQNITDESTDAESPSWTVPTPKSVNYTMYTGTYDVSDSQGYFTGAGSAAGKATAILAIPQDVPANAKVTITYNKIPDTGSPKQEGISKEILLEDFLQSDNSAIGSWKVNGRYTYVFSFGVGKKIFFKPDVQDWEEVATGYITID